MSLATLLLLGAAAPAEARWPKRCAYVEMWTDSNACYHERWRHIDCDTGAWLGTVDVTYC